MWLRSAMGYVVAVLLGALRMLVALLRGRAVTFPAVRKRIYVCELLAEGGFSFVHVARRSACAPADLVVKRMVCQDASARRTALEEVRVLRMLQPHHHILELLDTVERSKPAAHAPSASELLLLFPRAERSLRGLLDELLEGAPLPLLPPLRALRMFEPMCAAVAAVHARGLVHWDVKPANFLLFEGGARPVLGDLGSARPLDSLDTSTRAGALHVQDVAAQLCSMPFRAPELFDVRAQSTVDGRTDVWALGCTLFAMLYGYSPFECDFPQGAARPRVVECSHSRVLAGVPRLPAGAGAQEERVMRVVGLALDPDPLRRPRAAELLDAVQAAEAELASVAGGGLAASV